MTPNRLFFSALVVLLVLGNAALAQDARNMSLLGNFGKGEGESKAVFAAGSLVYYGIGNKIQIASFSNPASPVKVSSVILSDVVEAVVRTSILGTQYLVATGGSKMWLINVQSAASPSLVSTTDVGPGATCEGVATSGTYAYVAAGGAGLKIYSISNPAAPSLVASVDSLAYCESVVISSPYAYIAADDANYTGRSFIFDISTPSAPVYKSTILGYGGYHQYMAVRGVYAYICDYNAGLQVVNVSSVTSPVNVTTVASGYRTASIVFDLNTAYVAVGDLGMKIYDVSNLAAPVLVSTTVTTGRAAFVSFGAVGSPTPVGYIFVANRNPAPGVSAINVSVPSTPTTASFLAALPPASGAAFSSFYLNGSVYVAYGTAGLRIIDVSNPTQPTLTSLLPLTGECRGIVVKGTTAYVSAIDSGLVHVVDVSTLSNPVKLTTIKTSPARGIALNGNTVYVATRDSGLVILDVTTPSSPVWLTPVRGIDVENVTAVGNVVGILYNKSIRFYDATDPVNLVAKGSTPTLRVGYEGFAIAGTYAYVPDGDSLKIFNIADLQAPALLSKIWNGSGAYGYAAAVAGDYCYVAAEGAGVRAVNISNPAVPVEDGYYNGAPVARGVTVNAEFVYVAERSDGLSVYRNNLLTSVGESGALPREFVLGRNYPNPFNPSTTIDVELARGGFVTLEVFNLLGQRVAVLLQGNVAAGTHHVKFDASGLSSGAYVYRLQANGFSSSRALMLVK